MSQAGLESFGACQKARQLFGCHGYGCAEDESVVLPASLAAIGSADSICANIEEGWKAQPYRVCSLA